MGEHTPDRIIAQSMALDLDWSLLLKLLKLFLNNPQKGRTNYLMNSAPGRRKLDIKSNMMTDNVSNQLNNERCFNK